MAIKRLIQLANDLEQGVETSRSLLDQCIDKIHDLNGEGERVFTKLYLSEAKEQADVVDRARKQGKVQSIFAGIPLTIKDLFDVEGETTTAGSRALIAYPAARKDAVVVSRLRAMGLLLVGKTNMTEFAYSGLGINKNYGTPKNPYDRLNGRIPGGSTSGGAISVTDGMAFGTIGTDTGGSCRIPAALSGIVGFKSTAKRVPHDGVFPLSKTQDSIGPLANSVGCCAVLDSIISGEDRKIPNPDSLENLKFGVVKNYVLEDMDKEVSHSYARALSRLSAANVRLIDIKIPQIESLPDINSKGGFVGAEAYAWHRSYLENVGDLYDPWVRERFEAGKSQSAADYLDVVAARERMMREVHNISRDFDCLIMPTVPIIAPKLSDMADDKVSLNTNRLLLRNTSIGNFLDRCAISIPCHRKGEAPVGLMLMGEKLDDAKLLSIAAVVEKIISN